MKRFWDRQTLAVCACCAVFWIGAMILQSFVYMPILTDMAWNVTLAALAFFFAKWISAIKSKLDRWLLFPFWLLLFPNGPYMLTDAMHASRPQESAAIGAWVRVAAVASAVVAGVLIGLLSLSLVHDALFRPAGRVLAWPLSALCCLAAGCGVYIGRFLRFNSWDILRPAVLFDELRSSFGPFFVQFTLLMALCMFLLFALFRALAHRKEEAQQ